MEWDRESVRERGSVTEIEMKIEKGARDGGESFLFLRNR